MMCYHCCVPTVRPARTGIRLALVVILVVTAVGCSVLGDGREPIDITAGTYSWGFEDNSFSPCNEAETWWVVTDAGHAAQFDSLQAQYERLVEPYEQVFVRLRGYAGPKGRYGHLGNYAREFSLEEVIEVRRAGLGDCYLRH